MFLALNAPVGHLSLIADKLGYSYLSDGNPAATDELKQRYREMTFGKGGSARHMRIEVIDEKMQKTVPVDAAKNEVFVAAAKEVLTSMKNGPFLRYLATYNRHLWTDYLQSHQVHNLYANMVGCTSIKGRMTTIRPTKPTSVETAIPSEPNPPNQQNNI
jgi:hypothetical protein